MKTRMRRFWISVSLAAGSLALPLSGVLRAHDLPTRWTSAANSTGAWNYLTDDCFDMPMLPGNQLSRDVEQNGRRGTEDWASTCPAEWAADLGRSVRSAEVDYESLLRNPISRFSKEMTCWVNEWQMIQRSANLVPPARLWAQLPDNGNPPAPDYSVDYVAKYEPVPVVDTCAFDAEYQARQTAADLLAREIARASEISRYEARVSQAIADAERVQAIIDLDSLPASAQNDASEGRLAAGGRVLGPMLCGGETREIMTADCFPRQYVGWKTKLPYMPDMIDEYVAYDLQAEDHHWLGGLGKSWKLRSALSASPIGAESQVSTSEESDYSYSPETDEMVETLPNTLADSITDSIADAVVESPESFVAPDLVDSGSVEFDDISSADLAYESAQNAAEIQAYFNGIAIEAQRNALGLLGGSSESDSLLAHADVLPGLLPDLGQSLAAASEWIENQQCIIASELCGFDSAYRLGDWLGDRSLDATQTVFQQTIAMAHYLDVPAESQAGLDVYVIYIDAEGNSLAVPASLARAWNRPEIESTGESEGDANSAEFAVVLDQVGTQVLSVLANKLNSIGMQILQASDLLSSWADTQIASRESSSIK